MTFSKKRDGNKKLTELKILDKNQLYTLETCKIVFTSLNNNLSENLELLFQLTSSSHTYVTRITKPNSMKLPTVRTNKAINHSLPFQDLKTGTSIV